MTDTWLWISRWEDFQHYQPERDRGPAWIKQYTKQLDDDRYTDLPPRARSLLHDVRMAFARCSYRVCISNGSLANRVMQRVYTDDLKLLVHAGFIEVVSREVLEERLDQLYASRAPARSRRQQQKKTAVKSSNNRSEEPPNPELSSPAAEDLESPRESEVQAACESLNGSDRGTFGIVMPLAAQITTSRFREIMETVEARKRIKNKPGLLVNLLQIAVYDQRIADVTNMAEAIEPSATEKARRDPERYITAMAQHLTEHDLRNYLAAYVKDESRHDQLTALWQEHRAEQVPA